ncbi:MAG TPA: LysR family transcriptional regulator [Bryobacteraceae bacterium]|nr:LysR family transcriptional regulator [Bryobacteraceae bacterium]
MIELRLYRYFVAVAEMLHFGRAAESLGIAQPPLSQQIQALERQLGVTLLQRTRRKVELTEPGRVFLTQARRVLEAAGAAEDAARRAGRGEVGRLAIAMVSSATYEDLIPAALLGFRERFPDVALELQERTTNEQIELLHRGTIQIGFVRPPIQDPTITLEVVKREPLVIALPAGHRLAGEERVAVGALASDAWIMLPPELGLGFYDLVLGVCLRAGFTPEVSHVASQIHTMIGLVAAGLGVTLVPASVRNLRRPGVLYRELIEDTPMAETAAAYLASSRSAVLGNFLDVMRFRAAPVRER